ncbi:MAG TPA: c-type cytochrome [Thiobacillaceae bacterium]|nr:c-type cytochrome [Thiobacillaceae bacterium]HNU64546.1 c-type cytochrome [Thiobacillaceae bacterium]
MKAVVITGVAALALSAGLTSADETLARKNACMSCHQTAKKVVGPAFRDVARKYRGDARAEAHLLAVIKQGGKGVWGDIPMPPQPRISDADARRLVHWVLAQ